MGPLRGSNILPQANVNYIPTAVVQAQHDKNPSSYGNRPTVRRKTKRVLQTRRAPASTTHLITPRQKQTIAIQATSTKEKQARKRTHRCVSQRPDKLTLFETNPSW